MQGNERGIVINNALGLNQHGRPLGDVRFQVGLAKQFVISRIAVIAAVVLAFTGFLVHAHQQVFAVVHGIFGIRMPADHLKVSDLVVELIPELGLGVRLEIHLDARFRHHGNKRLSDFFVIHITVVGRDHGKLKALFITGFLQQSAGFLQIKPASHGRIIYMGSDYRVHIDGKDLTPQEISAMILTKIRRDAESYLGEPVTEAVITVPAYFDDSQRKATQDAGRIAGLNVLRIINEPTAAAVAYGLDNEAPQKILVYDLGGGTFDVSIIEIEDGTFTVLATGGDTRLGGDDFDQRIVEYAVAEFKKSDRIDLSRDPAAMGRLKEEAEKAKKELSSALSAQLNLPFIAVGKDGPHHLDLTISRPQFEMMTGDLLARTVAPVQNALRDAGISASQLGKVLLVGGSTRMPAVERQVKELLGCEPSHSLNPDECVAMGAAVQGGLLQGGGKLAGASGAAAQGLVLMDVTPLTLSIETLGGVATPLITRNSMIPTRKSQIFTTARPMQTSVEINVLQGARHFARDNKSLGKFKLNGIRASFSSKPQIEVTFDIDVNGVVKVSAKDLGTGREQNITITGSTNLSENEIQRAMADAAAYEAEDSRRKERLDLHNQAEVLAYKVDEALSKCKKELDKEEKNRIKADVANLRRCLRKDKPEKMNETEEADLRQAKSQLEASANHLMVLYASEQSENGSDGTI